jgi:HK97 family phage portal protein
MAKIAKKKTYSKVTELPSSQSPVGKVKHLDNDAFGQDDYGGGVWDPEIKAFMEAQTLKGLFFTEGWVFMLLDLIAEAVSSQPMVVKKTIGEEDGKVIEETVDHHPALTLLEHPNEFQEYASFIYNYTVELDLMGNAIVFYARNRQNLLIMPAETVNLKFSDKGKLEGYQVMNDLGRVDAMSTAFFPVNTVWHQRRPNPNSLFYGLSPFLPNSKAVLFNRYTQDWLNSFYLKGATPTVALKMENNVDEKSALRFLRSFEMAYTGRRNMRRPLVLPKGVSAESLSPSVADQQLIELIDKNRENIINILRVPKHALSLAEAGSLGSEEHKQALKFFWSSAVIPTQKKLAEHFTRNFRANQLLEEDERLEFDNSEVEVLRDDLMKKAELSEKMLAICTPNEIRKDIWDKEPIEGGDELQSAQQPAQAPFSFGASPRQEPEPQEEEEQESKALIDDDLMLQAKDYREGVVKALTDKYADHLEIRAKQNVEVIEGPGEKAVELWKEILEQWSKEAIKLVAKELGKAPARQRSTKAQQDEVPLKIPSKRRMKKLLERDFSKEESKWLDFVIEDFNDIANDSFDTQVAPVTGEDNVASIAAIKERDEAKRRQILSARAGNAFADISKTQIEAVMKTVEKGIEDQTPLRDIGKQIEQRFDNIGQKRAETIARTEALTAVSVGKQAALESAKEVLGEENLVKVWMNLGDLRVRGNPGGLYPNSKADHWSIQGETREVDEPFTNGLMYPRDLKSGDPAEVINCRCDFLMVPREDIDSLQT